jgi:hypothetical protein
MAHLLQKKKKLKKETVTTNKHALNLLGTTYLSPQ